MANKWTYAGSIGTLIILTILATTLYVSDYRLILQELKGDLFLLDFSNDKIEILSRSFTHNYIRWLYKDDYAKMYFGRDLVDTYYWRVYEGAKQIQRSEEH